MQGVVSGVTPYVAMKPAHPDTESMTDVYEKTLAFEPEIAPAAGRASGEAARGSNTLAYGFLTQAVTEQGIATPRRRLNVFRSVRGWGDK